MIGRTAVQPVSSQREEVGRLGRAFAAISVERPWPMGAGHPAAVYLPIAMVVLLVGGPRGLFERRPRAERNGLLVAFGGGRRRRLGGAVKAVQHGPAAARRGPPAFMAYTLEVITSRALGAGTPSDQRNRMTWNQTNATRLGGLAGRRNGDVQPADRPPGDPSRESPADYGHGPGRLEDRTGRHDADRAPERRGADHAPQGGLDSASRREVARLGPGEAQSPPSSSPARADRRARAAPGRGFARRTTRAFRSRIRSTCPSRSTPGPRPSTSVTPMQSSWSSPTGWTPVFPWSPGTHTWVTGCCSSGGCVPEAFIYLMGDTSIVSERVRRGLAAYAHVERVSSGDAAAISSAFAGYRDFGLDQGYCISSSAHTSVGESGRWGTTLSLSMPTTGNWR